MLMGALMLLMALASFWAPEPEVPTQTPRSLQQAVLEPFREFFRQLDQRAEQYTWWSNRGQAWAKNVGWRLDYQLVTPGLAAKAKAASIYKDERFSDHAPLTIDYDFTLK